MLALLRAPNSYNLNDPAQGGYLNPDGSQRTYFGPYDNPFWSSENNPYTDNVNRMLGNISLNYTPESWVKFTYRLGSDVYTDQRKQVFAIGSNQPDNAPGGEINEQVIRSQELYSDLFATFNKTVNDITSTLMLGNNLNYRFSDNIYARGRDLGVPGNYNLSNASNLYNSGAQTTIKTAALFFDLNLGYKNMVFLGLTGRNEWASTFGGKNNSFFYPSTSLGFVFTELVDIPYLSFGKIRLAWAQSGTNPPAYFTQTYFGKPTYTDGFTGGLSFPYLGVNGYGYNATLGNSDLKPERVTGQELGFDLRFLEGRLGLDFTYYNQKSTDILVSRPIAPSTGFTATFVNSGEMVNKGVELVVNATPLKLKDFQWDLTLNYSKNNSEVLKLAEGVDEIDIESGFTSMGSFAIVGKPYGVMYGTKWSRTANGELIIKANGLPAVDAIRGEIGNPYPDWLGGFRNTFTYKDISLSFLIDIRKGGDIWNGTWSRLSRLGQTQESADGREKAYIISGVKQSDPTQKNDVPVSAFNYFSVYQGDAGGSSAENAIQDGGWVRLRDISLSYHYKITGTAANYIKFLDFSVTGRNLWLSTDYKSVDPETSLTGAGSNIGGWDYFNNPGTKSYTIAIRANF